MISKRKRYHEKKVKEKKMKKFYSGVIKYRYGIMVLFVIAALLGGYCRNLVKVDYDMNDYLPETSPSTVALDVMNKEFDGAIPNARVMIKVEDKKEALDYKEKLEDIDGVTSVMWMDDAVPMDLPFSMYPTDTLETYYKDGYALYQVTIEEEKRSEVVSEIYDLIGEDNAMMGSAVSTALATTSTVSEIQKISVIAVLFLIVILTLTTTSWVEPFVVLIGLGVAILINAGSNLIFGEISFVTNAAGNILQLAVSLDYSVFLIHRFDECRKDADPKEAMKNALSTSSILSSGLTTVIGFLALVMMRFGIGPDLGLALAKGIAISLLTVFLFMPIQLGATVDYAILFTERYKENRQTLDKKESIVETVSNVTVSILTSGVTLTVVGFLLGIISTHGLLSQLGYFLGKGTICSMIAVLFVLPCFLYVTDGICIERKKRKQGK